MAAGWKPEPLFSPSACSAPFASSRWNLRCRLATPAIHDASSVAADPTVSIYPNAMIDKLERWAWWGGASLAGIAGVVNVVGLQSYTHQAITHVTGTTTLFSQALARGNGVGIVELALILLSFTFGAALGGFIIQDAVLRLGRRYGVALFLESILLFVASALMHSNRVTGGCVASIACGLQNAMASTYSGTILRTSHLTGMYTDIGAAMGHLARGAPVAWIRIRLYTLIIASFGIGGVIGSLLYPRFGSQSLYFPAALTGVVAIVYTAYAHARRKKA